MNFSANTCRDRLEACHPRPDIRTTASLRRPSARRQRRRPAPALFFREWRPVTLWNKSPPLPQGRFPFERQTKPRRRRFNWLPFWLILPTVVVLLAIQVYPVFYTLVLSVQERKPQGWVFVGHAEF